jgi:diguanylate cyclase (GGDEF)-like protein
MSGPRSHDSNPQAEAQAQYERLSPAERIIQLIERDEKIRLLEERYAEALKAGQSDELTKILNRRGLREEYEKSGKRAQRNPADAKPDLLAVIDLDDFKSINDSEGHDGGDKTLKEVAGILGVGIRGGDVVGRYGGDEFIAFLYGATPEEGAEVAERLRQSAELFHDQQPWLAIPTLSIGVAEIDYSRPFEEAVKLADDAMYQAKQTGKNQVHILPTAQNV